MLYYYVLVCTQHMQAGAYIQHGGHIATAYNIEQTMCTTSINFSFLIMCINPSALGSSD